MKKSALSLMMVLTLSACATAYESARDQDTAEAYRTFLRDHPKDPAANAARARLSELEFLEARLLHTLPAYKRFLVSFPDAPRARDAQLLVEGIRFEMAAEKDTSESWLIFLRDHSQGPHAKEARERLEDADYRGVKSATTSQEIRVFLGKHPTTKRRQELEKRLDELEFQEATTAGSKGLATYLESNPSGAFRSVARDAVLKREAMAEAQMGNFDSARSVAQKVVDDGPRQELLTAIDDMELEFVTASLSPKALDAFIQRLEQRHEDSATLSLAKSRKAMFAQVDTKGLRELADLVDPTFYARPQDELIQLLGSADPRNRWLAAMELGRTAGADLVEPLVSEVALSKFSRVRRASFEALKQIFQALPQDAIDLTVRARISALEKKAAQDVALFIKLAVLRELSGDLEKALIAYESALRLSPGDAFALFRSVEVNLALGKAFRAGVLARELAFRSKQLAEQWSIPETSTEGGNPTLVARTLCGTLDDAKFAQKHLSSLSEKARAELADDADQFIALAQNSVALVTARLGDAEAEARSKDNSFIRCGDEKELTERLDEGVARRKQAVHELTKRTDELGRILLNRMSLRDPEPSIRSEATDALKTLGDTAK